MTEVPTPELDPQAERESGILTDRPTLSGLPDDAPDELRATLSGDDRGLLPTEDDVVPDEDAPGR